MLPTIWNKRDHKAPKTAIYIGRGSAFGNPYIGVHGTREQVILLHMEYARKRLTVEPRWLAPLAENPDWVCWCKPLPCHGDNYVTLLKESPDG